MRPYQQITDRYHQLTRRRARPEWLTAIHNGDLDDLVAVIRDSASGQSDDLLRALTTAGRSHPDALTVALYALLPALQARHGRTVTDDYRTDMLTDLTLVLLDSPLDGSGLAHRVVNRAHNRTYKAALRTRTRGEVTVTTITPCDPDQLTRRPDHAADIATTVAQRVDLARFGAAVQTAICDGRLSADAWAAYRDHRLRRAVDDTAPVCGSHQRTTALRTARKLTPLIASCLHAA